MRADYGTLASDHHTPWDVRVLASGDPSGTIIDESHSEHYDLLVLGSGGAGLSAAVVAAGEAELLHADGIPAAPGETLDEHVEPAPVTTHSRAGDAAARDELRIDEPQPAQKGQTP